MWTSRSNLLIGLVLVSWGTTAITLADEPAREPGPARNSPWRLSLMAYTYRKFTLFEAIDQARALGLKHLETYGWQAISPDLKDVPFNPDAPVSAMAKVKNKLDDAGVRISGFYAQEMGKNEDATRKVFDFAKLMEIPTLICEPPAQAEAFEMIDRLANAYRINVAIHNHPAPSTYADPETALKLIRNCSPRIGICADTGHWVRSRLNPAECLKRSAGRLIQLHLKDVSEAQKEGRDVPWGTCVGDIHAQLAELHLQGFDGIFSIEYESNPDDPTADVRKCIEYFKGVAGKLGR